MLNFHCRSCGAYHDELPLAFGPDAPASWDSTSREERTESTLSSDQCVLNGEFFFVRGCLDLPIRGSTEIFRWLVWVSVSEADFARMSELWEQEGRELEPPYFGWLNVVLPYHPSTFNLKVNVHTRPVGERPFVEVEPTGHPLAVEQREGITWGEVQSRIEQLLHGPLPA